MKTQTKPKIQQDKKIHLLVIDDDPTFLAMMKTAAKKTGFEITTAGSLREVDPMAVPKLFDVVVLDYYLDNIKENLKGTDVALALEATPIILTSSTDHAVTENVSWSTSIRRFISKKNGPKAILSEVQHLLKENHPQVEI